MHVSPANVPSDGRRSGAFDRASTNGAAGSRRTSQRRRNSLLLIQEALDGHQHDDHGPDHRGRRSEEQREQREVEAPLDPAEVAFLRIEAAAALEAPSMLTILSVEEGHPCPIVYQNPLSIR